jgi:hypothetical protein
MRPFFKSPKKIALAVFIIILLGIQFVRPAKNTGEAYTNTDITVAVNTPDPVKTILVTSCYDCHSNYTDHRWYENIQPIGWWIADHIKEGKGELNFSEFNNYNAKRKAHKFEEIIEMVEEDKMPLSSYTLMHGNAKLSPEQKLTLQEWAKAGHVQFKNAASE